MSSEIEDITAGAARGTLDWTSAKAKEMIKNLVVKFQNRTLSFIGDPQTIEIVKTEKNRPELQFVRRYIKNQDLLLQVEMGFVLRKLEKNSMKLQNLRDKIVSKYGTNSLHVAQFAQNGVFDKYFAFLLENAENEKILQERLETILTNIEKYVVFIKKEEDAEQKSKEVITRINANLPMEFIIFSSGQAINVAKEIALLIMKEINKNYRIESQTTDSPPKLYQFIIKVEQ